MFTGVGEMTEVKIERCAVLVPPPLASSVHEWDKTTRITRGPNTEMPTTYSLEYRRRYQVQIGTQWRTKGFRHRTVRRTHGLLFNLQTSREASFIDPFILNESPCERNFC